MVRDAEFTSRNYHYCIASIQQLVLGVEELLRADGGSAKRKSQINVENIEFAVADKIVASELAVGLASALN